MHRALLLLISLATATAPLPAAATKPAPSPTPAEEPAPEGITKASLVRVNSTGQAYDFFRPWIKKAPFYRRGLGIVVPGGHVLVSAELVANHTYLELETPDSTNKTPAEVVRVDYDCNLALLKPGAGDFLKDARPISLDGVVTVGEKVDLIQLEPNGDVARTPGTVTTISVIRYPMERLALLSFRLSVPLQGRDGSFTIPAIHDGKLLGIVMRYDGRNQTADVIPAPVISRFLTDLDKDYSGFPRAGLAFSSLRDPQLRRYAGLQEPGGVYVTEVRPGGSAAKAGLQRGDIILAVNGHAIDQDGNYEDASYGRISLSNLITTQAHVGDKVDFTIFRNGQKLTLPVTLEQKDPDSVASPAYVFDRQPRYFVLGGLVFQELSRPYLQEWGSRWRTEAPQRLVALDAFQNESPEDSGRVVFLSQVFPTNNTLGYENLEHLVVSKVNGVPVKSLDDLARAAASPQGGFQKIEFDDDPPVIYLDAAEAEKANEQIRQEYGIPELKNLN